VSGCAGSSLAVRSTCSGHDFPAYQSRIPFEMMRNHASAILVPTRMGVSAFANLQERVRASRVILLSSWLREVVRAGFNSAPLFLTTTFRPEALADFCDSCLSSFERVLARMNGIVA
jgi:hypothetical protein